MHRFARPITLAVHYTPDQLAALGLSEADLTLYWFDDTQHRWTPLRTEVDPVGRTATSVVDHFSGFQLGDGSSPSAAFVPSLQGWQVGLYSGDVSYEYPLDLPAAPGGLKPDLHLRYDSAQTDGPSGMRAQQQSGWVGKGWSLDTGAISLNKVTGDPNDTKYYSLSFNGQALDLVRGECVASCNDTRDPSQWAWHPRSETYIRARAVANGPSYGPAGSGRGGFIGNTAYNRYKWEIWTKDGTRYEFAEDAWWAWTCLGSDGKPYMETYKWYLSDVVDVHGNEIQYNYAWQGQATNYSSNNCAAGAISGTNDYAVRPTSIVWGHKNDGANSSGYYRYKLAFDSATRVTDNTAEATPAEVDTPPTELNKLVFIRVLSNSTNPWRDDGTSWDLVRQYNLAYGHTLTSDASTYVSVNNTYQAAGPPKLTLNSIQMLGSDANAALPPSASATT